MLLIDIHVERNVSYRVVKTRAAHIDVLTKILAEARHLVAAERSGNVSFVVCVDEDRPGLESIGDMQCLADVACEDARRQAVFRGVCSPDHSVNVTAKAHE